MIRAEEKSHGGKFRREKLHYEIYKSTGRSIIAFAGTFLIGFITAVMLLKLLK